MAQLIKLRLFLKNNFTFEFQSFSGPIAVFQCSFSGHSVQFESPLLGLSPVIHQSFRHLNRTDFLKRRKNIVAHAVTKTPMYLMKVALFLHKSPGRELRFYHKINWFLLFKLKCTISWKRKKSLYISLLHMQCSQKNPMYLHSVMKVALFLPKRTRQKTAFWP